MRITVTFIIACSFVAACGKSEPAASPPPATAPTTPAAATTTPAPPTPNAAIVVEARPGQIVFDHAARRRRVTFTVSTPQGWQLTGIPGEPPMDGADGMFAVAPSAAGEPRDGLLVSGGACIGSCTPEAFAQVWAAPKAAPKGAKVVRQELLGPGLGVFVTALDQRRSALVERLVAGEPPLTLQCLVESDGGTAELFAALLDACTKLEVTGASALLSGELLAAEEAKLAACPAATTVSYTPKAGPAFGPVKKALALQLQGGVVDLRIANHEAADLTSDTVGAGTLRLDARLHAGPGKEVTSGTYRAQADKPPTLVDVRLVGADPAPSDDAVVVVDEGGDGGITWRGPDVQVEVVARTQDKICGRFTFKDATHEARGEFNLDLEVGATAP